MRIIFHHSLRSIKDNLGQLFVIVFTITVLTALFFATLTLRDVFYNLQLSMANRLPGDAQISVSAEIISEYKLDDVITQIDDVDYVDKYLEMTSLMRTSTGKEVEENVVLIEATDLNELIERHSDKLFYSDGIDSETHYSYPAVWMSVDFARINNVAIGDVVELFVTLYNSYQKFTITYLFESEGIFANTVLNNVLTDFTSFGDRGLITNAYIKLNESADVTKTINDLKQLFDDDSIVIENAIDYAHIEEVVSGNESLITVVMFFVLALVLFILFSSYLVIFQKRTKELIIFKSAGASPRQCILLLMFEGLLYGATGATIGTILGRFAMQIVEIKVIPNFTGAIQYHFYQYILSLLLGVGVSIICSFFPAFLLVKKTSKTNDEKPVERYNKKLIPVFVSLIVALLGCVILIMFFPNYLIYFCVVLIILIAMIIYFGTPYLVILISGVFSKGKGTIKLASCSVKRNRNTSRLPAIVGAVISFSFIAVSIVSIVIDAIEPYYSHFRSDFVVQSLSSGSDMDDANDILLSTYGVDNTIYLRYFEQKMIADNKEIEYTVYGIDDRNALSHITKGIKTEQCEKFFSEDNCIIISYDISNRLNKRVGDEITLLFDDIENKFVIVGIDTTVTKNDRVCFVLNKDKYQFTNSIILVNSNKNVSNMDLYKDLSVKLHKQSYYIVFYDDWTSSTNVGISGIELLLRLLQILIGAVAFIGVINMTVSTLIDRKREYNIYMSAGLDTDKYFLLLLIEGIIFSLTGGVIGLLFSLIINLLMPDLAKLIDRYIPVSYFPIEIPIVVASIIIIYIIVYVLVGLNNKKKISIERNII